MADRTTRSVPAFVPKALAALQVGVWEIDVARGRAVCDATAAMLLGLDPAEAAAGMPVRTFGRFIHPDDVAGFIAGAERLREANGVAVLEHRLLLRPGDVRWVQLRGRSTRDPVSNSMLGRGIIIDLTESRIAGPSGGVASPEAAYSNEAETPLERAAGHALDARAALDACEGPDAAPLRRSIDAVLWSIGRALARRVGSPIM